MGGIPGHDRRYRQGPKNVLCPNKKKKCANCEGDHPAFESNGCRKAEDFTVKLAQMVAAVHAVPLLD